MPRGIQLSSEEKGIICVLSLDGLSQVKIAKHINRSKKAVHNSLQHPKQRNAEQRSEIPKMTKHDLRRLHLEASNSGKISRELRRTLELSLCVCHVHSLLRTCPLLPYKKLKKTVSITPEHKLARVN